MDIIKMGNSVAISGGDFKADVERYVLRIEDYLEKDKSGLLEPVLSRNRVEVAFCTVDDAREAGELNFDEWIALRDRLAIAVDWMIDNDRW